MSPGKAGLQRPELVCPAGTPAMLRAAVDAGADAVYCGLQNATNARNFPGLNFTLDELRAGRAYTAERGAKLLLAVNTFPPAGRFALWQEAVDLAAAVGVDAIIVADAGVAAYASSRHPDLRLHLSVQAGASSPEAINFYSKKLGVKRVVLPRILTVSEIKAVSDHIDCEIEAFVFGNIGNMAEGRCSLTNFATGISTNMDGVCSPAASVSYEEQADRSTTARLGDFAIDCFSCDEAAGYPTICKGRYTNRDRPQPYYAFEEPRSLNLSSLLPDLVRAGVSALKIEGRQRSRAYVSDVVSAYARAIDVVMGGGTPDVSGLLALTEGQKQTKGAFETKRWR